VSLSLVLVVVVSVVVVASKEWCRRPQVAGR
jgi:hypothetical protein